uniref:Gloverin-like protein n=1 Tax=Antheraea mylitta TaxID=34739 RepID=Q0Q035_ANTMY|nr:gloverin-like protein [Antheraea mylitta]
MQSTLFIFVAAILASVYTQVSLPPGYEKRYPEYYKFSKQARHPRDITWDKNIGNGKVFGTLGQNDDGLFGKAGYKQQFFNDHRGKLEGQAYGTRVLGAAGDSTNFGGRLDWSNKNANAALDVSKQIGGRPNLSATGSGVWNFDKNTRLSAGGSLSTMGRGKPDVGVQAQFQHDF